LVLHMIVATSKSSKSMVRVVLRPDACRKSVEGRQRRATRRKARKRLFFNHPERLGKKCARSVRLGLLQACSRWRSYVDCAS